MNCTCDRDANGRLKSGFNTGRCPNPDHRAIERDYQEGILMTRTAAEYRRHNCPPCRKGDHRHHQYDFMDIDGNVRLCRCGGDHRWKQ